VVTAGTDTAGVEVIGEDGTGDLAGAGAEGPIGRVPGGVIHTTGAPGAIHTIGDIILTIHIHTGIITHTNPVKVRGLITIIDRLPVWPGFLLIHDLDRCSHFPAVVRI